MKYVFLNLFSTVKILKSLMVYLNEIRGVAKENIPKLSTIFLCEFDMVK